MVVESFNLGAFVGELAPYLGDFHVLIIIIYSHHVTTINMHPDTNSSNNCDFEEDNYTYMDDNFSSIDNGSTSCITHVSETYGGSTGGSL